MAQNIQENQQDNYDQEDAHHVHFSEDIKDNTKIAVKMKGTNIANVHLGFLRFKHKYEVEFTLQIAPDAKTLTPSKETPNIIVRDIKLCQGESQGHSFIVELNAQKEGLQRDKFYLTSDTDEEFVIVIHARVIGTDKGTPMYLDGIRCIGAERDDEGEGSDWAGFE